MPTPSEMAIQLWERGVKATFPFKCGQCHQEIDRPGWLLFSPPSEIGICVKIHLCATCGRKLAAAMAEEEREDG